MAMMHRFVARGGLWVIVQAVLLLALVLAPGAADTASWSMPWRAAHLAVTLLLASGGTVVLLAAALRLGASLTPFPAPLATGQLVTSGVYRLVRHPIYAGIILLALALAWSRFALPAALPSVALLAFFDRKARREERWLSERYPDYPAYRQRSWRFVPWLY